MPVENRYSTSLPGALIRQLCISLEVGDELLVLRGKLGRRLDRRRRRVCDRRLGPRGFVRGVGGSL
jgi:hypothetical protein